MENEEEEREERRGREGGVFSNVYLHNLIFFF